MENESKQLNEQAQELMQEERWVEAINLIESHSSLFEQHAELSWNLGWAYFKLENWKAAQVHLSRARGLNPKLAAAWWALGAAQMKDGVLDEAESNVKEALRIRDLYVDGAAATHVDEDFQNGVKFLTMAIDRFRNEKSHTADGNISDPIRAYEYLRLSSLAMHLLERAQSRPPS